MAEKAKYVNKFKMLKHQKSQQECAEGVLYMDLKIAQKVQNEIFANKHVEEKKSQYKTNSIM